LTALTKRQLLTGIAATATLAACSKLDTLNGLNRLTPGDGGVRKLVDGASFGSDVRQRLDVFAPAMHPVAAAASLPVVVFLYGGGWNSGDRGGYAFAARALAARGFVVVVPDYRLVPQVVFPTFVEDCAAALRWTVDRIATFGGDPARIGVAGHSAGAYNAMMLALDPRFTTRAGVPKRIRAVVGLSGPYDFLPLDASSAIAAFGHYPDLDATQPIHFVRRDAPPALLITGDADTTVRPRNAINLDAALKRVGASSELRIYPGLGHIGVLLALSKPFRGKGDVLDVSANFLAQHLG